MWVEVLHRWPTFFVPCKYNITGLCPNITRYHKAEVTWSWWVSEGRIDSGEHSNLSEVLITGRDFAREMSQLLHICFKQSDLLQDGSCGKIQKQLWNLMISVSVVAESFHRLRKTRDYESISIKCTRTVTFWEERVIAFFPRVGWEDYTIRVYWRCWSRKLNRSFWTNACLEEWVYLICGSDSKMLLAAE